VAKNVDSLGADGGLQEVVGGQLDVCEDLGFKLIGKLLNNGDTSDGGGVHEGTGLHSDLIGEAVLVKVLIVNAESGGVCGFHIFAHTYRFHSFRGVEEYQHFLEVRHIWLLGISRRFHPEIVRFHY
jgi:hypothetical protein